MAGFKVTNKRGGDDGDGESKASGTSGTSLSRGPSKKAREASATDKLAAVGFNAVYADPSFADKMGKAFKSGLPASHPVPQAGGKGEKGDAGRNSTAAEVNVRPFRSVVLPNIFDSAFLAQVREEVMAETFFHKSNDLYEFFQSDDLKLSTKPCIKKLREAIYSRPFVSFMESLTGLRLSETVDLSAHRYPQNGYLLCHDDAIGSAEDGRRIAFIIYLVEDDWRAEDGGMLQLFDCDDEGRPGRIVRSIVPQRNAMAFFEVLPTSHHEVQQVFCARERVSISGWFHGPEPTVPPPLDPKDVLGHLLLRKWLNPAYLTAKSVKAIADKMAEESTVELQRFVQAERYAELRSALDAAEFNHQLGPANARRFRVLGDVAVPAAAHVQLIDEFVGLLGSAEFAALLRQLTNMDLRGRPAASVLREFGRGDYTLMHDHEIEPVGLDVVFSCPGGEADEAWDDEAWSGGMHYIADKETLLSLFPSENTLFLVSRDQGTMRFVKMVTAKARKTRREVSLVYVEEAGDE
ncbi:putative component of NuA3 histone acetyltransferase complex [Polyrhizophydium stewartii]|uniref:Component of NuA3 histone acetyltransferase complex n=1 Tax=Polyrhizophydium stewartii TaxID=2732419 RepID=A0ABR4MXA8_9FUNG|nr:Prolyl 3-hydroxylase ogfod1 [Polyrhizophydium stewartii]